MIDAEGFQITGLVQPYDDNGNGNTNVVCTTAQPLDTGGVSYLLQNPATYANGYAGDAEWTLVMYGERWWRNMYKRRRENRSMQASDCSLSATHTGQLHFLDYLYDVLVLQLVLLAHLLRVVLDTLACTQRKAAQ